ncbi:MAG: hypothetical protein ACKPCP_11500, partial [Sphaerospermopsis kisseleviana]
MERLYKGFEYMQYCFHPQNQQHPLLVKTIRPVPKFNRLLQKRNYGTYLWGQVEAYGISRCLIFPSNYRP